MNRCPHILLVGTAAIVGGCTSGYREPVRYRPPATPEPSARPVSYIYPESPPIGNADVLGEMLKGYQRQGQVVLLDVWSVSSKASRDRFDSLIDLREKDRALGLQCLAVSFDNPGVWKTEIAPFLRSVRCSYPCILVPQDEVGEVVTRFGYEWNGGTPAILLFDRDGMLAAEFLGSGPFSAIRSAVENVLAGKHKPIGKPGHLMAGKISAQVRTLGLDDGKTVGKSRSQWGALENVDVMAKMIADRSEATVNWPEAKVAVLPFTVIGGAARPNTGQTLADVIARILKTRHPAAVVDREEADAMLARYKLTPLGVEYDPTELKSRTGWTHIITGTLRLK